MDKEEIFSSEAKRIRCEEMHLDLIGSVCVYTCMWDPVWAVLVHYVDIRIAYTCTKVHLSVFFYIMLILVCFSSKCKMCNVDLTVTFPADPVCQGCGRKKHDL